jgi:uncharacterized protein YeaO (DUF488 family)
MNTRTTSVAPTGTALRTSRSSRTLETASGTQTAETAISRDVRAKRIYEPFDPEDGYRVLIDHVWPRGISHERARLDAWARELAPSDELRTWFDHRPPRFGGFRSRYRDELAAHSELLDELRRHAARGRVTVLYAARDREHNNAVVLVELLRDA